MGRNYWCEFCNRGFADILSIRKKHVKSIQHQRLRKLHYDSFKDPLTLLQEESKKTACRKFFESGHCDFGEHCKFSHQDISELKKEVENAKQKFEVDINTVNKWIESWKKNQKGEKDIWEYNLPDAFPSVNQLPPSLQPLLTGYETNDVDWG